MFKKILFQNLKRTQVATVANIWSYYNVLATSPPSKFWCFPTLNIWPWGHWVHRVSEKVPPTAWLRPPTGLYTYTSKLLFKYCFFIEKKKGFLPNLATLAHPLYLWRWIFIWSPSGENRPKNKRDLEEITETVSCKSLQYPKFEP